MIAAVRTIWFRRIARAEPRLLSLKKSPRYSKLLTGLVKIAHRSEEVGSTKRTEWKVEAGIQELLLYSNELKVGG